MQVNRSLFSSIAHYVPPFSGRKGTVIAAFALGILSLGCAVVYCILKGRVNRGSMSLSYETRPQPPSHYPDFANMGDVSARLMAKSRENPRQPSFEHFKITLGTYAACGPGTFGSRFISQLQHHLPEFRVIVNLLTREENDVLEDMGQFLWQFGDTGRKEFFEGQKRGCSYIHFFKWPDMAIPAPENIDSLLRCAARVADLQGDGVTFVHCMRSLQRTPTFLLLVELLRQTSADAHSFWSMDVSEKMVREYMFDLLSKLASTAEGRVPTNSQLEMLFSKEFIARLTAFAKSR